MLYRWTTQPTKWRVHPSSHLATIDMGQKLGGLGVPFFLEVETPLGTEVDLGPGHIVLDGVPSPAKGAQQPPSFRPMSIVATIAHLSYSAELL